MNRTSCEQVSVHRSRSGLGRGLFAEQNIPAGECVAEYTGVHIPTRYADTLKTRYLFALDDEWTIDGSARDNLARYINHSCMPNCEAEIHDGRIYILSTRDIALGEELTIDYGDEYFDEFIRPHGCKCVRCLTHSR
ncbi:SET domain-containing protein-lysine N-methyltransferase [Candidatus Kaiserbacteria bacterium]|nr:SET domain-containing protein-lysine N-methyltransferase [Candidatus Kaiserbacteria bacterium]